MLSSQLIQCRDFLKINNKCWSLSLIAYHSQRQKKMFKALNFICTGEILEKRKQESICNIKNRLLPGNKSPDGLVDWVFLHVKCHIIQENRQSAPDFIWNFPATQNLYGQCYFVLIILYFLFNTFLWKRFCFGPWCERRTTEPAEKYFSLKSHK